MSVYLTRNAIQPGNNNVDAPGVGPFQMYEKAYTSGTTQEWIYAPDFGSFGVVLGLTSAGTGAIEKTCSPPSVIEAGNASVVAVTGVTASTFYLLEGITAFRVNMTSGAWKVSVRC